MSDLDDEAGSPTEEFKAFAGDSGMNRSQSEYCNVGSKTSLTNHPAKKYVFDFMRVLIMDNMCMTPASKQTPVVDMLLEVRRSDRSRLFPRCESRLHRLVFFLLQASPERSTRTQQKEFQSSILDGVMEHLLAADVLLGQSKAQNASFSFSCSLHSFTVFLFYEDFGMSSEFRVCVLFEKKYIYFYIKLQK